ncbi:MAG: energy transducer TonB [Bacteriovoracaceae bacterium]|nr:energy transducer TonB [Bacteriovoracaceae bacterium]
MTEGLSGLKYFISASVFIHLLLMGAFLRESVEHKFEGKEAHQISVQLIHTATRPIETKIVKKITPTKSTAETSSPESSKETSTDTSPAAPAAITSYASKVESLINQNKRYPRSARALKQAGLVFVSLTILKDGKLKDANVIKKSQFYSLDKASLDTIEGIGDFPKFPEDLKTEEITFTVPINFNY